MAFLLSAALFAAFLIFKADAEANNVCKTRSGYYAKNIHPSCYYDPDVDSNVTTLFERYGYEHETHKVVTPDGYILTIFRISPQRQHQRCKREQEQKQAVLLIHIALGSAAAYSVTKNDSLAFVLADAGFDVYLANLRGSQYSQGHLKATTEDEEYWNYTIDEIARYDVPAYLDVVEGANGNVGTICVTHSISTSAVTAYATIYPEAARKRIKLAVLFSQTVQVRKTKATEYKETLGRFGTRIWRMIDALNVNRYLSAYKYQRMMFEGMRRILGTPALFDSFVRSFGPNTHITIDQAPVFLKNEYVGLSMKAFIHALSFSVGPFAKFDYGVDKNIEQYGRETPPRYQLSKIRTPLYMVYAPDDYFSTVEDVEDLYAVLPKRAKRYGKYMVAARGFNHLGYSYAKDARGQLYDHLVDLFDFVGADDD